MRRMYWGWTVGSTIGLCLLCAVMACALPDNPYQRFQLTDGTIYNTLRYAYERIHFDSRPIDVAIVGPSRSQLGLSAAIVQERLSASGRPANVENFSIIADGRNIEWLIVNELFKAKSPRIIVVAVDETPYSYGHPGFKYAAPAHAIAFPPTLLLHNYLYDLSYLPFRQIKLFAAKLLPALFDLRTDFDAEAYAATPTDFTVSHRLPDGRWIEMNQAVSHEQLMQEAYKNEVLRKPSKMNRLVEKLTASDDHVYIQQIATLAQAHGAKVIFVFIPLFDGSTVISDRAFLERYGTIVDNGDLAHQDRLFEGWAHFNHAGAVVASDRLAAAIANAAP